MTFASKKKMEQFVKLSPNQYISMVIALGANKDSRMEPEM